uniref:Uncharacterized protein n=1 Tax=Anguilla anguilla TaxID=7936 RepID=A0A0E9WA17_ANGAN
MRFMLCWQVMSSPAFRYDTAATYVTVTLQASMVLCPKWKNNL